MRRHGRTRLTALMLGLALTLAACGSQDVREDPRGALRDAIMELRQYEGFEAVVSAKLDEAAQRSAMAEGGLSEQELEIWTSSTLTVRVAQGDDGEGGNSEFVLVVGDETVLSVRTLGDHETYALVDLPAVERVAASMGAGDQFAQGIAEFEQLAGLSGMGQVASAAREAEWIRVAGLQDLAQMNGQQDPDQPETDDIEVDQLAREIGERLLDFLDDPEVDVTHLGDESAGERVRVTASGTQLRELAVDLVTALDHVAGTATDSVGMGATDLRDELEESISDDLQVSFDVWLEDEQLSQVAVDVFELARMTEQPDVPEGEFLLAIGLAEFAGDVEAPDAAVTFDMMDAVGSVMGDLGGLGGLGDGAPDDDAAGLGDDLCVPTEQAEQLLDSMGEDPDTLDEDEMEARLGLPIC